ncbi:hypothetical protein PACTADRAFT_77084 [Pachysolen tannophilus NRRL Y-2460]|uniref:Endoplasmic reticulum-Golgi intermediate compartment protein n=1 Tax=Pachysolen tannophilus NRRL Y-2460 TaxID=669874 RepID=A0A1E4TRY3_PACTA|nr:hypothetical protein PACTADRAFT_77084 [Pachysolen tannophilus NRRL Y-2460]
MNFCFYLLHLLRKYFVLQLVWIEVGGYIDGFVDHQFNVDSDIERNLFINLDMLVAMPCNFIHTNILDMTEDRTLASEVLNYEGAVFPPRIPSNYIINDEVRDITTPEIDQVLQESLLADFSLNNLHVNEAAPACHIFGSIPVTKVKGDFHITGKGYGYRDRSFVPTDSLNFTHVINEFSFGAFYPYMVNPLDGTGKVTKEYLQSYQYFLSVVPTLYKKLGVLIETNQYAMTQQARVYEFNKGVPGIFFKYDFEPIQMRIEEKRIPFLQFIVRLITICGGIMVIASYSFRLTEKLIILIFGKKYAELGQERPSPLLDKDRLD